MARSGSRRWAALAPRADPRCPPPSRWHHAPPLPPRRLQVVDALVHRNLHDPDADLEPPDPERLKDPDVAKLIKARPVSGELDRARAEAELEQFEDKSRKFTKLLRWSAEQAPLAPPPSPPFYASLLTAVA